MKAEEERERETDGYKKTEAFKKRVQEIREETNRIARECEEAEIKKYIEEYKETEGCKKMEKEMIDELKTRFEAVKKAEGNETTNRKEAADGKTFAELQQPELKGKDKESNKVGADYTSNGERDLVDEFEVVESGETSKAP